MPLRHAFSILCCNLKLVVKVLIFVLVLILIAGAIFIGILHPIYTEIRTMIESENFVVSPEALINHPINTISDLVTQYTDYIQNTAWQKNLLLLILTVIGFKFFLTLPLLPITKELYTKMSTGFDIGLLFAFIATGLQNLLLSLCYSIVVSVVDMAAFAGSISLCVFLIGRSSLICRLLAFPVSIILFLFLLTARMALTCQWLPEICRSESRNIFANLGNALKFSFKQYGKNFLCLFFLNLLFFAVLAGGVFSFGVLTALAIPFYYVLYCILTLTLNFTYHKAKYYLDNGGGSVYKPDKLF